MRHIQSALDSLRIMTVPDFRYAYIDGLVSFVPAEEPVPETAPKPVETTEVNASITADAVLGLQTAVGDAMTMSDSVAIAVGVSRDPTYRIGKLESGNNRPVSIAPDATVSEAITIMLKHDFSQLPVMTSDREVKGLVSWKSLGSRLSLGHHCRVARDCMEPHHEITSDTSLFAAIDLIISHECVLVRDATKNICGIVTISDIGEQFGQLSEPFLLLGEIENHVRDLIDAKFAQGELEEARDPSDSSREIHDVSDLTFGEYLRLLENPQWWEKLGLRIDRKTFVKDLDKIRRMRNDVMHFDPDGIGEDDLATLRRFVLFLQRLRQIRSN